MQINLIALLSLYAIVADAHWWWHTKTVTVTSTSTKTEKHCTATQKCSSFGSPQCTSSRASPKHQTTTPSSTHPSSKATGKKNSTPLSTTKRSPTTLSSSRRPTSSSTPSLRSTTQASTWSRATTLPRESTSRASVSPKALSSSKASISSRASGSLRAFTTSRASTPERSSTSSRPTTSSGSNASPSASAPSSSPSSSRASSIYSTPSAQSPSSPLSSSASLAFPTPSPSTATFVIRAASPAQAVANGQYAVVNTKGGITFSAADPASASLFGVDSLGHLIFDSKYAQTTTSDTASQVQFLSPVSSLSKRQSTSSALTCVVGADTTGNPILQCAADASTIQQACGTGFYLGASLVCQPLVLTRYELGNPAAVVNTPTDAPLTGTTPGQRFTLQGNPDSSSDDQVGYAGYASLPPQGSGQTGIAFSIYLRGAPFSLDADGHLLSVGPTRDGSVVTYVATLAVGTTQGPVVLQNGEVPPGYTPIVCRIVNFNGGDGDNFSLQCGDGDTGLRTTNELRCSGGNLFYLGGAVVDDSTAQGCRSAYVKVRFVN